MSRKKIIVYLAELIHSEHGMSLLTVPLGIGVIGSYCKAIHKDNIEVKLFRRFNDLMDAVKKQKPDVLGMACFSWNDSITLATTKMIRTICPETIIVFGGSSIVGELEDAVLKPGADRKELEEKHDVSLNPYNNYDLLSDNPEIDFAIYGDGEIPFSNVIAEYMANPNRAQLKKQSIDGCMSLMDGRVVAGKPVETIYDLDVTPSPYTTGLFTEFLEDFKLTPQIETIRGCPFKCTFCTVGGLSPRLRRHSLEYIKEEILYLKDHSPNKILRIADPNWGIVEQDIEVAEFIKELHDTTGYPSSLRVYYSAKGPIRNIKIMAKLMKNLLPLNMSFQTLNKGTLKNIKRSNFSLERIQEMREFGTENGLATSTELISGLPGESYQSFREGFLTAVKLGIDSVYINPLYLIKGAELDDNKARVEFGFKSAFTLIGKDVTKINGRYIFEKDEMVIRSHSMTEEDYWEQHKFRLFGLLAYAAAFLKEIIRHGLNYDITPLDLFDELVSSESEYPFFYKTSADYIENIKGIHFDTHEALEKKIAEHLEAGKDIGALDTYKQLRNTMGRALGVTEKQFLTDEAVKAAGNLYKKKGDQSSEDQEKFFDILNGLREVTPCLIISPCEEGLQKVVEYKCHYDLVAWAKENYEKPLAEYYSPVPMSFACTVRNIDEHRDLFKLLQEKDWNNDEKLDFYFTTVVSSNLRRFIEYSPSVKEAQEEMAV